MATSSFGTEDLRERQGASEAQPANERGNDVGAMMAAADELTKSLAAVHRQIVDHLLRRASTSLKGEVDLAPLAARLDRLEAVIAAFSSQAADTSAVAAATEIRAMASQQQAALAALADDVRTQLKSGFERLGHAVRPAEPDPARQQAADTGPWERAIFGAKLADQPDLAAQRQQLLAGLLANQPAPCGLAGSLLIFQAASAERLPQLLKEVGEAYYRWQPKTKPGTNPFEESLAKWLEHVCEKTGIPNTIELVHPGERFDVSRHSATSRGVEIAEVHGWIVLRDNGRVYAKANVTVR